ncbi:MAG: hypothetical protein AB1556_08905 [Bacillota bacterium]
MDGTGGRAAAGAEECVEVGVGFRVGREKGLAKAPPRQEEKARLLFRETVSAPSAARRYRTCREIPVPASIAPTAERE